jgi:hypothetical protein
MFAAPTSVWAFAEEGGSHSVNLKIEEFGTFPFDATKLRDLFVNTFDSRVLIRLLVDGSDERVPLQFRFLSLYKIVEHRFRKDGRWDRGSLDELLDPYKSRFEALGFTGKPSTVLHNFRDRCAHVRTGKGAKGEALGLTHLNHKDITKLQQVFPILRAICVQLLNERLCGKVTISASETMDMFLPVDPKSDSDEPRTELE